MHECIKVGELELKGTGPNVAFLIPVAFEAAVLNNKIITILTKSM